jgi:hypothetical protein
MFDNSDPLFSPQPFWFASSELLTEVIHAEINTISQLLVKCPDLRNVLDAPEATPEDRALSFTLLAHRNIIETIDEKFVGLLEESPPLDKTESSALNRTYGVVASDAPTWVQDMLRVVESLPSRINASLPEPLRSGGYDHDNPERMRAIESAKETLSSVEQVQAFTEGVLDQQLKRLEARWSADRPVTRVVKEIIVQEPKSNRRKVPRKRDKQRIVRDKLIAEIADISPTPCEFLKLMDERKVAPLPMWKWPGSWVQAYKNLHLRKLIQQDKSRALTRARHKHSV